MAMTASDIQYTFKVFGKMIRFGVDAAATADQYESFSSVTNRQISPSGTNKEYDEIKYLGVPLQQQAEAIAAIGDAQRETMKSLISSYLQNALAVDLGLPAGTNPATVAQALATAMTQNSQTATSSGAKSADTSFAVYFFNNFAATLPQAASATCPDTWITNVMVP